MGRISDFSPYILQSLSDLGVSVRIKTSDRPEEDECICLPSCLFFPIDLHSGRKRSLEIHGEIPIRAVHTVEREQNEKGVLSSSRPLTRRKSNAIFSLLLLQVFMVFAMLTDVSASILESPENQVSSASTEVIMKCTTNSTTKPLIWAGFDHTTKLVSIYDGEKVNPAYQGICSVTPNAGRYDLQVQKPQQLALMLKCIEPGAENIERTSELIVIESDPTCVVESDNATNTESVNLVCTMELSGNWIPTIRWRFNGIQKQLTVVNKTERPDGQRVIMTSTLKSVPSKDKQKYMCDAFFTSESYQGDATAKNVPAYMYTSFISQDMLLSSLPPSKVTPSSQPQAGESTTPHYADPARNHGSFTAAMIFLVIAILIIIALILYILHMKSLITLPCLPRDEANCHCVESKLPNGKDCPCLMWHKIGLLSYGVPWPITPNDAEKKDELNGFFSELTEKDEATSQLLELKEKSGWKCQCFERNENTFPHFRATTLKTVAE